MQFKKLIQNTTFALVVTGMVFSSGLYATAQFEPPVIPGLPTPASLQIEDDTATNPPTVQAGSITTDSANFGIDMTVCFAVFDWETYVTDTEAGRNTNPYIEKDCLFQEGVVQNQAVTVPLYKDFRVGSAETKAAIGNTPVVGVFPNGGFTAQGIMDKAVQQMNSSFDNVDRSKMASLTNIFTQEDLNNIFSTNGGVPRTGMPRKFHTGPEEFATNAEGIEIFQGGWCKAENGNIVVRDKQVNTVLPDRYFTMFGVDKTDAMKTCALPGDESVLDSNLEVYQFLWEIPYPTGEQCQRFWGVDETACKRFYRDALGKDLAGDSDLTKGERLVYSYTFYGSFDDKYTKWVRWATPDVGNRTTATDAFIKSWNGYVAFEMEEVSVTASTN